MFSGNIIYEEDEYLLEEEDDLSLNSTDNVDDVDDVVYAEICCIIL